MDNKKLTISPGEKYGMLTILTEDLISKKGIRMFFCKCDCGNVVSISLGRMRSGNTKSCGCLHKKAIVKHGLYQHPMYNVWREMHQRCNNKNHHSYNNYGALGITICDEWEHNFIQFYEDMKDTYSKGLSIDRIDNSKGYSKYNCRWSTVKEQLSNRRITKKVMYNGKEYALSDLATKVGIKRNTLYLRLYNGYDIYQAIEKG